MWKIKLKNKKNRRSTFVSVFHFARRIIGKVLLAPPIFTQIFNKSVRTGRKIKYSLPAVDKRPAIFHERLLLYSTFFFFPWPRRPNSLPLALFFFFIMIQLVHVVGRNIQSFRSNLIFYHPATADIRWHDIVFRSFQDPLFVCPEIRGN